MTQYLSETVRLTPHRLYLQAILTRHLYMRRTIGKSAGEQLIKLQTLGLTSEEAEAKIIEGFLRG